MKRQTKQALDLLRAHPEGVTPKVARDLAGIDRLAPRVWELRNLHGYVIETRLIVVPTRGGGARVASYVLHEPEPEQLRWSA